MPEPAATEQGNTKEKPHYHGHRARLRARAVENPGALADYELLELLLFGAHQRKDVKPAAKELLRSCGGSLAAAVHASDDALAEVAGVNEAAVAILRTVRELSERALKEKAGKGAVIGDWKDLIDYCRMSMGYHGTEQFRVLYLNTRRKILEDALQEAGTVDHTPVYTRDIVKRALALDAKYVILAHNHPGGDPQPSKADISLTSQIQTALKLVGIDVLDHVIVTRSAHFSFSSHGYL